MRLHYGTALDTKIESTKYTASEGALGIQPVLDKIAYQDNGWLQHEVYNTRSIYRFLIHIQSYVHLLIVTIRGQY